MKKILGAIFLIAVLGVGIAFYTSPTFASQITDAISFSFCDKPTTYTIGTIDERFDITDEELLEAVKSATNTWAQAYGTTLFVHDPADGELRINLEYDERQSLTNQINDLHNQIETEKSVIDPQIAEYESRVESFKKRVTALNTQIAYWNSRGGAPEAEFEKLHAEQQALREESRELDALAKKLNQSTDAYNSQIGQLNQTIDTFNTAIQSRPEEGLYNGKTNTITIYFMSSKDELKHTLTHEFGHALGIDHVQDPHAVMYRLTNDQLSLTKDDLKALTYACRDRMIFDLAFERFIILGEYLEEVFQRYNLVPQTPRS